MIQKNDHTWDIIIHYHRCPACSKIFESREDYQYCLGKYKKFLQCPACDHYFTATKQTKSTVGKNKNPEVE